MTIAVHICTLYICLSRVQRKQFRVCFCRKSESPNLLQISRWIKKTSLISGGNWHIFAGHPFFFRLKKWLHLITIHYQFRVILRMTDVTNTRITRNITACKNSSTFRVKITEANFSDLSFQYCIFSNVAKNPQHARNTYIHFLRHTLTDSVYYTPSGPKWIPMAQLISNQHFSKSHIWPVFRDFRCR